MGALDGAFGSLVPQLLGVFSSTPATFTRSSFTFDPANDTNVRTTLTAQVLTSPPEGYSLGLISDNNSTIQSGDRKVTAAADTWGSLSQPQVGDEVSRGEMVGTIIQVSPINSGDAVVAYELQVRTP